MTYDTRAGLPTDPTPAGPPTARGLKLELLTKVCGTGACPTVYDSGRGTLIVQGYAVPGEQAGVELPDGELLVEIPLELLAKAARAVS